MSHHDTIKVAGRTSLMHAILPSLLHPRIPLLASVQRTISNYGNRSTNRIGGLLVRSAHGNADLEVEGRRMELAKSNQEKSATAEEGHPSEDGTQYNKSFPKSSPTQIGSHLLNAAAIECRHQDPQSQAFARQLHINSMAYLLQGLPQDLTDQEILHLQCALPQSLKRSPHSGNTSSKSRKPSILHRGIATAVLILCLVLRLTLPYIKYFLAVAYNYERSHHVRETTLALSMNLVDQFGKIGMGVMGTAANNRLMVDVITYCVEGVCGGLNEGLGEGTRVIGVRNQT